MSYIIITEYTSGGKSLGLITQFPDLIPFLLICKESDSLPLRNLKSNGCMIRTHSEYSFLTTYYNMEKVHVVVYNYMVAYNYLLNGR